MNDIINFTSINAIKIHKISLSVTNNTNNTDSIKLVKNAEKQNYQQEIIKRFYPNKSDEVILNNIQNYCIAIQSFIYLLDFTYKHNPNLVLFLLSFCADYVNRRKFSLRIGGI